MGRKGTSYLFYDIPRLNFEILFIRLSFQNLAFYLKKKDTYK